MTTEDFNENLRKIVKGNKDAWRVLYEEYYAYVFYTAYMRLKNRQDAEDIATDVIISLCSSSVGYVEKPRQFLYTVTLNKVRNFVAKYYARRSATEVGSCDSVDSTSFDPTSSLELEEMLRCLDDDERIIFVERVFWQVTFEDIAKHEKKWSVETVRKKYKRACAVLRQYVKSADKNIFV